MSALILLIGLFSQGIGFGVLWANPRRWLNRTFCTVAIIQALWLGCVYGAILAGPRGAVADVAFWLRLNAAVSAFLPLSLWFTKESVITSKFNRRLLIRCVPWLTVGIILSALSCFESFLFLRPGSDRFDRGEAYYFYQAVAVPTYLCLVIDTFLKMRRLDGIQKMEMQFLALNLGLAAFAVTLLNTFGNFLEIAALKRLGVVALFSAYAASAWAITAHRIFDVRQVFTSFAQRVGLVLILAAAIASATWVLRITMPHPAALLLVISVFCSLAFWLDRKSRDWLDLEGKRRLVEARRAFIDVALKEGNPDELVAKFAALLCGQCQTERAILLPDRGETHASATLEFRKQRLGYTALCEMGWATPESLERRRSDPSLADLHRFLTENALGAVVVSPRGSRQPSLLVALGIKTHLWPFTYPEVQRLQNIAELMDYVLTRARLAMQQAAQAKIEHLAMMSRGLAHDLRNLITPISSFLVYTDARFPAGGPEAEVHSAAKHSVQVMTDYVREALFFSERLAPNFKPVDLAKLLSAVRDTAAPLAARREVTILIDSGFNGALTADFVLLQRMLMNLVSNAIDASNSGQSVAISAAPGNRGHVLLQVSDDGYGVAPENIGKIFNPYFTTKEFGNDVRGFGLGLTICQKIVHLHNGSISVDSQPGRGATFTVEIPADPVAQSAHDKASP
jgi:signal transduction histidine kinase